jgi:hypothetical protein
MCQRPHGNLQLMGRRYNPPLSALSHNFGRLAGRIKSKNDCLPRTLQLSRIGLNCLPTGWMMLKASDMVRDSLPNLAF